MSAYTTLSITRSRAKAEMLQHLMGDITDRELESYMDSILGKVLYNCRIVDDTCNNDDEYL